MTFDDWWCFTKLAQQEVLKVQTLELKQEFSVFLLTSAQAAHFAAII